MGAHTITAYPSVFPLEPTNATITNRNNIFDSSDSSYGVIDVKTNSYSDFRISGFDFSSIPVGSVINSVKLETRAKTESSSYVDVYVIACRKYKNGSYASQGTNYNEVWFNSSTLQVHSFTGTRIGTWTRDEIASWRTGQPYETYTGIEFYIRVRNSYTLGARSATIYYFKVVVDYTVPDITYTYKNYDGTVLKTQMVEQGTSPTPPSNPTRPSTAEYSYTFSGWSLSGTTYTAQYTATRQKYTISASAENGSISGGGAYEYGTSATLTAIPNNGYKFSHWLIDGVTSGSSNPISISVTKNTTVVAIFQRLAYVTYDSILNFQKWKDNGISGSNAVVSNITNIGFTITSNDGVSEGTASSPFFEVEAGKSYKIDIDIDGDGWDVYIFFHSDTSTGLGLEFTDGGNRFSSNGGGVLSRIFTAPEGSTRAQIRVDANGANNTVLFSNFRVYPAEYEYMGDSITAEQRSNLGQWDMPIPERAGYNFIGWNTKLDGGGIFYTENSAFPTEDTILYSQWEVITLPDINSVQITPNPCNAGQGFIISVGFTE
ncbi:MAG: InlB B-repeat-containing protein [Clostridia bacterium]|nr:InlB B-repeat-containing protein [Clostridia bacterium]